MGRFLSVLFMAVAVFPSLRAQQYGQKERTDSLLLAADSLRHNYEFEASVRMYTEALESATDSLVRLTVAESRLAGANGLSMTDFVSSVNVVARHRFTLDDFFLFYPLEDGAWRELPNILDPAKAVASDPVRASYVPGNTDRLYFSARDSSGMRNIYMTELPDSLKNDSLWTTPALLGEDLTSPGNEIYPMLSPDGKSLYFASDGLYGMGGYDLYESRWDDEAGEWGQPVNMGFPYSSPYDDFLFVNTPDGKYSIFASNRDCPADSVWVYVLEYDSFPIRRQVKDPEQLRKIASLETGGDLSLMDNGSSVMSDIPQNVDIQEYTRKMTEVRALRDSISAYSAALDGQRNLFAMSEDEEERARLTGEILRKEMQLPVFRDSLSKASSELQKIEMEFLFSGVIIDPEKVMAEADREVVGASSGYTFSKRNMGKPLKINFVQPEEEFDYSFRILPEAVYAENTDIPDGIVYQIQLFLLTNRASLKDLRGLCPVFETKTPTGKYIYTVGLFMKLEEAASCLEEVKALGFKTAYVTAFRDGEPISVTAAKELE